MGENRGSIRVYRICRLVFGTLNLILCLLVGQGSVKVADRV